MPHTDRPSKSLRSIANFDGQQIGAKGSQVSSYLHDAALGPGTTYSLLIRITTTQTLSQQHRQQLHPQRASKSHLSNTSGYTGELQPRGRPVVLTSLLLPVAHYANKLASPTSHNSPSLASSSAIRNDDSSSSRSHHRRRSSVEAKFLAAGPRRPRGGHFGDQSSLPPIPGMFLLPIQYH